MELDWQNGSKWFCVLNAMSGGHLFLLDYASKRWAKTRLGFHASDVGMLSLAQELLVNKGAGVTVKI